MQNAEKMEMKYIETRKKEYELLLQMAKILLEEKLLSHTEYTNILTMVREAP